jgi:hypothetical protein
MPFEIYAPVSDTNKLPIVHALPPGAFAVYTPVSETNPLPIVSTPPSP